jgi:hypothetical protein
MGPPYVLSLSGVVFETWKKDLIKLKKLSGKHPVGKQKYSFL